MSAMSDVEKSVKDYNTKTAQLWKIGLSEFFRICQKKSF